MKSIISCLVAFFAWTLDAATIRINGSTSMADLNRKLTAEYTTSTPVTTFDLVATDSTEGIAALVASKADIAASSRQIKPAESSKLERLMTVPVARDAIVVYVHSSNPVSSLTFDQLAKMFSGAIRNWSEVGGANAPIQLYVREAGSGTQQFFREQVLGKEAFPSSAKALTATGEMINAIARDPNAIGFASAVFTKSVKPLALSRDGKSAVTATRDTVTASTYPLARVLYFYLARAPQGELLKFVQWVMSPSGQQAVARAGFFPAK